MRLIATWMPEQNPAIDFPVKLEWADGSPATIEDFSRIDGGTQSDPHIGYKPNGDIRCVSFGYDIFTSATEAK